MFHLQLDIYGFVGLILLIGIVKKNAIMMVDFALELERTGNYTSHESAYQGCMIRFRPIMTAQGGAAPEQADPYHMLVIRNVTVIDRSGAPAFGPVNSPRPRYQTLELQKRNGWSAKEAAPLFLVSPNAIHNWLTEVRQDTESVGTLVRPDPPVQRFADAVRRLVHTLDGLGFGGNPKLAQVLARAGYRLSAYDRQGLVGRAIRAPLPLLARSLGLRRPQVLFWILLIVSENANSLTCMARVSPTDTEAVFAALANESRRNIVLLLSHLGDELPSGYLAARFQHSWPTTTRHLGVLEKAGLVEVRREGRGAFYRLNRERVLQVVATWLSHLEPVGPEKTWTSSGPKSTEALRNTQAKPKGKRR